MNKETVFVFSVGLAALLAIVAFLVFSPSGGDFGRREVPGPPSVQPAAVAAHAAQFDVDLPERAAGSQQEQAAATYLLGVLQRNGYVVRLDPVPVGDLVASTNLIAQPAQISEVATFVVVPYGSGDTPNGESIGLFLEVARALSVADPDHRVGFVALGAEFTERAEGSLGSRRLARFLLDEDLDPAIVQIVDVAEGLETSVTGDGVTRSGPHLEVAPDVFAEAGFDRVLVAGSADELGPTLLGLLRGSRR